MADAGAHGAQGAQQGGMPRLLLGTALALSLVWVLVVLGAEVDPLATGLKTASTGLLAPLLVTVREDASADGADALAGDDDDDDDDYYYDDRPGVGEGFELVEEESVRLVVESPFPEPVLFVRVGGSWCKEKALEWKQVFLADGISLGVESVELFNRERANASHWTLTYKVALEAPCAGRLRIDWRLEYSSLQIALADYPAKQCSFQGRPSGSLSFVLGAKSGAIVDPNLPRDDEDSWLLRKRDQKAWRWASVARRKCVLRDKLPVTVIGDSQPSYMCANWRASRPNVFCEVVKGPLNNRTIVENYLAAIRSSSKRGGALVINVAGLWETAYGSISLYRDRIEEILRAVLDARFDHVFYITTTTVHPIHYDGIFEDQRKWAMTAPRVHALNLEALSLLDELPFAANIQAIDLESLSFGGEDDPMDPSDMRHYGDETNAALAQYVTCQMIDAKPALRRPFRPRRHAVASSP